MVFPKAHVAARFGSTGHVHCIALDRLRDYIDNAKYSQKLTPAEVDRRVRAVNAIAAMDEAFDHAEN